MKNTVKRMLVMVIALVLVFPCSFPANPKTGSAPQGTSVPITPHTKNGKKWRVGYCETESFVNYASTLYGLIRGLEELGWLSGTDKLPYRPGQKDARSMWEWLATHDTGPYIEFVKDGFYTFDALGGPHRAAVSSKMINRLNTQKDIDLMIAMGTWAGQELACDRHSVPVMVFSTSDAVRAGIIKSAEDSGSDHVWAHMDPNRYRRQIEVFYDIFHFKKLGMVYEDSPVGRAVAAVDDVEAVARERGFQIVKCNVKDLQPNHKEFNRQILEAHRKLAGEVDAMYLTLYSSRNVDELPELLAPFYENKIPVFAQSWATEVKHGALMSVSGVEYNGIGKFGAEAIARVLNGASPRSLPQVYETSPQIILNLEVADKIGYKPPFESLLAVDEVFQKIK